MSIAQRKVGIAEIYLWQPGFVFYSLIGDAPLDFSATL